jgi:DNA-nicking Smr family endonuclease
MSTPRGLSDDEAAAWAKLAHSVTPLEGRKAPPIAAPMADKITPGAGSVPNRTVPPIASHVRGKKPQSQRSAQTSQKGVPDPGLDSHWDRKFKSGVIAPDFTLDLHGHTLDSAHARLDSGLAQARAMDARVVLLIAGKPRPVDPADRGQRRGAIRAKILDWLAAGPHGSSISAIRKAHRRHGGEGALYLILKRKR